MNAPPLIDHPEMLLERVGTDGFRLAAERVASIDVRPGPGGWGVSGPADLEGWALGRIAATTGRFLLADPDGREAGRTCCLEGLGLGADLYYLLMGDGRLFRIAASDPREPRWQVHGWESEGAYLVALPRSGGWRFVPTPACGGLSDIRPMTILLAAAILDSETPLAR